MCAVPAHGGTGRPGIGKRSSVRLPATFDTTAGRSSADRPTPHSSLSATQFECQAEFGDSVQELVATPGFVGMRNHRR